MTNEQTEFHGSVTMYPNGTIFAGGAEKDSLYPRSGMIGKIIPKGKTRVPLYANEARALFAHNKDTRLAVNPDALYAKIKQLEYNETSLARLKAATIATGNAQNLTHLQLIRLFPEAQGTPDEYFVLDNAYVVRDVSMLEYRESFRDVATSAEYLGRMEESKRNKTNYDEIKYDLPKLVDKVYTPIEDIMRTIINPQEIDLSNLDWGMKFRREKEAARILTKIGNPQSVDSFFNLSTGAFHSTNRSASQLNNLFNQFLQAEDVYIDYVVMNADTLSQYSENTWTGAGGPNGITPIRVSGYGVIPMPGIQGVTAVISPFVPNDTIYALNKQNALRLGEGPKVMRRYYDEERDSEAIKKLDFHEYLSVNDRITKLDRNFAMTITVGS